MEITIILLGVSGLKFVIVLERVQKYNPVGLVSSHIWLHESM